MCVCGVVLYFCDLKFVSFNAIKFCGEIYPANTVYKVGSTSDLHSCVHLPLHFHSCYSGLFEKGKVSTNALQVIKLFLCSMQYSIEFVLLMKFYSSNGWIKACEQMNIFQTHHHVRQLITVLKWFASQICLRCINHSDTLIYVL